MSYARVIPRDLFNEANLLKCLGKIYINLETAGMCDVELEHDNEAFDVHMDDSSGALFVRNVVLMVRGNPCRLVRPMNSREAWPLMMVGDDDEETPVFDSEGNFSPEMLAFLRGEEEQETSRP